MDAHVLGVFKDHLIDLKEHMMQPHPPFTNETMQQIGALVNTAELFLNMSKLRVNQVRLFLLCKVLVDFGSSACLSYLMSISVLSKKCICVASGRS